MPLDIDALKTELNLSISQLDDATREEILLATASIDNMTSDRIVTVETIASLPDLNNDPMPSGSIFFVNEVEVLVVSVGVKWLGLDGRVARDDTLPRITMGWGHNSYGQIGDGTTTSKSSPVTVIGGITNWTQVSSGNRVSLGIAGGELFAWGTNRWGQFGTNTLSGFAAGTSPVSAGLGVTTPWSYISATGGGYGAVLGISEGVAYAWGNGHPSSNTTTIGDGTNIKRSSPVTVVGGITDWTQVNSGRMHSVGVTSTGIAYAWGNNTHGNLGDGTKTNRNSPVTTIGGITNWSQLSASDSNDRPHSVGIANGIAYAWGYNYNGALGDGTKVDKSSPVTVVGGITDWSHVSAGSNFSLGIANGIAYGWGRNLNGVLGDGTNTKKSSPVTVIGGITNWSQVSAGYLHSLGVTDTGVVYGWGLNSYGRVGDGTVVARSSPVTVVGGITSWSQVSTGRENGLGIFVSE